MDHRRDREIPMATLKKEQEYAPPSAGSMDIAADRVSSPFKPPRTGFRRRKISPNGTRRRRRYEGSIGYTSDAQSHVSVAKCFVARQSATNLVTHPERELSETSLDPAIEEEGGEGVSHAGVGVGLHIGKSPRNFIIKWPF